MSMENGSLSALQDDPTVTAAGEERQRLPEGVTIRDLVLHVDDRGTVCELLDPRWGWSDDPIVFSYVFTLRPGKVKGWGMHMLHEDRYAVIAGDMEVVMYDERENAPTRGLVASVVLSGQRRRLMNIPAGVWHCNHNIGTTDVVTVNFPTQPYDHDQPDKYRLPLDTDRIPYKWPDQRGW